VRGCGCGCLILLILILAAVGVMVFWLLTHGWAYCDRPTAYGPGFYPRRECTNFQSLAIK
jgi:hypothetical protein